MTAIEWTEKTWNPIVGCSRVSAGCEHCYAEGVAHRQMQEAHKGLTVLGKNGPRWNGVVRCLPERLAEPLRWRKPRRIFVNSMSDLFHESVPFEFIAAVFGVMAVANQHTFQVLTKRPARAVEFFKTFSSDPFDVCARLQVDMGAFHTAATGIVQMGVFEEDTSPYGQAIEEILSRRDWPLPNVHLLVSVEDQQTANERIPLLLKCPAAVRGVSYEPALGPVDFSRWFPHNPADATNGNRGEDLRGGVGGLDRSQARRIGVASDAAPQESVGRVGVGSRSGAASDRRDRWPRVPVGEGHDRRQTDVDPGAPTRLEMPSWADSKRAGDQPHQRGQERQPSRESGGGDGRPEHATRGAGSEGRAYSPTERRSEPRGEVDSGPGDRDSTTSRAGGEAQDDRGGVLHSATDGVGHRVTDPSRFWLIVGGESGPGARPFDLAWARAVVEVGRQAGVPVFVKQLGARPIEMFRGHLENDMREVLDIRDRKGGDMDEWPEDLRVREFPR